MGRGGIDSRTPLLSCLLSRRFDLGVPRGEPCLSSFLVFFSNVLGITISISRSVGFAAFLLLLKLFESFPEYPLWFDEDNDRDPDSILLCPFLSSRGLVLCNLSSSPFCDRTDDEDTEEESCRFLFCLDLCFSRLRCDGNEDGDGWRDFRLAASIAAGLLGFDSLVPETIDIEKDRESLREELSRKNECASSVTFLGGDFVG